MSTLFVRALSALCLAIAAQSSYAIPITVGSQISTGGTLYVVGGDGSVANATGLDFALPGTPTPNVDGPLIGYTGTGTLSGFFCVPGDLCGVISDLLSFAGFAGDTPFITAPGFSFNLTAPLTITRVAGTESAAAALIVSGVGTLLADGFDATSALFTLVTLNNTDGATTYSATIFSTGTQVFIPEPGNVLLMGLGALSLLLVRRKSA